MGVMLGAGGMMHTAECVSFAHPDKLVDRIVDAIVDTVLRENPDLESLPQRSSRVGIEGFIEDNRLILMGEVSAREIPDLEGIVRRVWGATGCGFGTELSLLDYVVKRSPKEKENSQRGAMRDQGVMIGYATSETAEMLPREFVLARHLSDRALECRDNGIIPWMRAAIKTQVTLDAGGKIASAAIVAHHEDRPDLVVEEGTQDGDYNRLSLSAYHELLDYVFIPVLCDYFGAVEPAYTVQGTQMCTVVGITSLEAVRRKIVMDAYGPRVPAGGEGYSGKDPMNVARSGAYMARYIAKTIVRHEMARECLVRIAYAVGKTAPVMISAVTEDGTELGDWVRTRFDLAPPAIIERLGLRRPRGWSYYDTSAYGHYGYECYPWEKEI